MKTLNSAAHNLDEVLEDPSLVQNLEDINEKIKGKKKGEFGFTAGRTKPTIRMRGQRYKIIKKRQRLARRKNRKH